MVHDRPRRELVWVLDDIPLENEIVRLALFDHYAVETFVDGAVMLEHLASTKAFPDLLIVDWSMPNLSGLDVLRFVRKTVNEARLPIVLLTAIGGETALIEGLANGANDFLAKPFNAIELKSRIRSLIRTKSLHEKIVRTEQELQREAVVRERFVGILGHDLRQPLNTMLLATGALSKSQLNASDLKVVERLGNATRRMQRMVNELMDFTRIRHGEMPTAPRAGDLDEIVEHVVEELRVANPDRDLRLTLSGRGQGSWDHDRVAQLCGNLIGNALEHGPSNRPVLVTIRAEEDAIFIEIVNEGPPIPAEMLPTLFDAFTHGAGVAKGLGLGLYIAEQIARAHGGSIAVASDDTSTRFAVQLPLAPIPANED